MAPPPHAESEPDLTADELRVAWPVLADLERVDGFRELPSDEKGAFFLQLNAPDQGGLLLNLPPMERRLWVRQLDPDDAADLLQEVSAEGREVLAPLLDEPTRREVAVLLAYKEDVAGGLMSPRFARVRPDVTVEEAILYLRRQARDRLETLYYAYVLDAEQRLLGVVSFRELFAARADQKIRDVMKTDLAVVPESMDQEAVARLMASSDLVALPVLDANGAMKGIVTVDDIVDVVQEEATEDIQKLGGTEVFDEPYLRTTLREMVKKRAGWLAILFVGEMLTASAMGHFQGQIEHAVVLALFVPLIISSGGNSGSQTSTLVIRAMALGEVSLRDWWRVARRELATGVILGAILGTIGLLRVYGWQALFSSYGEQWALLGATVALSLLGVVTWGTITGSMLPFLLRACRLDPASASVPFVATLVDVFGLVIYFGLAGLLLT